MKVKSFFLKTVILLALMGDAWQSVAQQQSTFFSNMSSRDGLPSNIIAAIAQDQHDFIWVGTGSGLARYDGYQFRVFKKTDSPNSLPSNELNTLLIDGDDLWIGTWSGLCKINTRTFQIDRQDAFAGKAIRALYKSENMLWVGTGSGLIQLNLTDNTIRNYDTADGLSHQTIRAIYGDETGMLWVGTFDGLNKIDPATGKIASIDLRKQQNATPKNHLILDIKPAFKNKIWIGTETGLYLYDLLTDSYNYYNQAGSQFSNEVIKCIYPAENGDLWLGTDFGLNVFNPQTGTNQVHFHNPQIPYSIANNVIWQIFEDRSGLIWLVTSYGLSKINKSGNFYEYHEVTFEVSGQEIGNQVKAVLVGSTGDQWLGTQRGVVRRNPKTGHQKLFDSYAAPGERLLLNNVFALAEDANQRIWIGSAGGINIWDEAAEKMLSITASAENGLTSNYIARFAAEPDGPLWVSAWEGGIFKISGTVSDPVFTKVPDLEGSEKMIFGNGSIWVIAQDDLYQINTKTLEKRKITSFTEASRKQMIYSICFSSEGKLWAGTHNGLICYNSNTAESTFYPLQSGTELTVTSILEDEAGNIWSTSNYSLQKFSPLTQKMEIYPLDQDLPLQGFYYGCATRAASGEILLGGDNGFITFYPNRAQPAVFVPQVFITSLAVNNQTVNVFESNPDQIQLTEDIAFVPSLTLAYDQRSVSFAFSSLHYWQPQMNVYAFRMSGLDDDWSYVSGLKNFAVYSSLPPGSYEFQVRATNNFGVESPHMASIQITVEPPIYLSKIFIIGYFIIIGAAIYYGLKVYSARVHLKNELRITRMEKDHAAEIERTKEQFFTNISHELRTPISLILPPIHEVQKRGNLDGDSHQLIALAEKNSVRLLRLVNQILDFNKLESEQLPVKVSEVEIVGFCQEIFDLFTDQARRHQIDFTFHTESPEHQLWIDLEKIETVLFNLLSNAFKFTPDHGSILVSIHPKHENMIEICVSDTGIGMSAEDQQHIFERFYQAESGKKMDSSSGIGLTLAAEYIKLHHGSIQVESEPGKGSTFSVQLPMGNAHFSAAAIQNVPARVTSKPAIPAQEMTISAPVEDLPKVLIVDDNDDILAFITGSLGHKYQFVTAANGEEGLQKAAQHHPEIIISDIMMPVMDGLQLCERIKTNPETSHMMVILLTAKTLPANRLEGIKRGADVYLTKPFEVDLLDAHIDNLLRRRLELTRFFRNELITIHDDHDDKDNQDNRFLKKVMDVIEANVDESEFTVEDLSAEIGMSSTHLYRRLKALTNHSAQDIIRKYRLKKASLLLQNNEGNVSETMHKVGFANQSYFSKCFKEEYGLTPSAWQKQYLTQKKPLGDA